MFKLIFVFLFGILPLPTLATTITTTIHGYVATSRAPTVLVGDTFSFIFNYDDNPTAISPYYVNGGTLYWYTSYALALTGGSGSLYEFDSLSYAWNGNPTLQVLSRPLGTVDHKEWRWNNLYFITDHQGHGAGHGWNNYLSTDNNVGVMLTDVISQVANVPEPESLVMMFFGLLGIFAHLRKRNN